MGLKKKITLSLIPPLILSIIITGLIVPLSLTFDYQYYLDKTIDRLLDDQENYLEKLSQHIAVNI